ncbi:MAG TPA: hypothetical protein DDW85_03345 [Porphyromonadaceae bacterium]|nr:hypothetical protein [Porphyromonadaceae bacterium]
MKYVVAQINKAAGNVVCSLDARRKHGDLVLLNENDLKRIDGTLEERAAIVWGKIINEKQAFELINSWKNE